MANEHRCKCLLRENNLKNKVLLTEWLQINKEPDEINDQTTVLQKDLGFNWSRKN